MIKISSIKSVVSMQPLPKADGDPNGLFFVVEKLGLDDVELMGHMELAQIQD